LCFDIGANIGEYTRKLLYLKTKVVSVEPQKKCLKILHEMYGRNKNVKIVGKAAGELEEFANMYISDKHPTISTFSDKWKDQGRFSRNHEWNRSEQVSVTTLDSLIQRYGLPKFCKIDVEGYELQVLKGLTQKIPFLSFEFAKEFSKDIKLCGEYLESLGAAQFNLVYGNTFKFLLSNWISLEKLLIFLKGHPDIDWGDIYVKFI
ncbi:MAG: FkbM family methyltransferase, partial [Promethearchaeota archaeon]